MSYMKIKNLYADQRILMLKECLALEKIHGCVKMGTMITLANGESVAIENLSEGVNILSYDINSREFVVSEVEKVFIKPATEDIDWFELIFDSGNMLICTEDHPILTSNRGWVEAKELTESDNIVSILDQ